MQCGVLGEEGLAGIGYLRRGFARLNKGPGSSISKAMQSPSSTAADRQRHSPSASRYAAEIEMRPWDRFASSYAVQPRALSNSGTVSFMLPIWGIFPNLTRAGLFPILGIHLNGAAE